MKLEWFPLLKAFFIDSYLLVLVAVIILVLIAKGLVVRTYRKWRKLKFGLSH